MKTTTSRPFLSIVLIAACVLAFGVPSRAVTKESSPLHTEPSPAPSRESEPTEPSSPYWQGFLWESLPAEWLRDQNQSLILEAYQQHDWKPFFISPHFELTSRANALLQRLEGAEKEGLDPKLFKLEALRKSLQTLKEVRTNLKTIDPRLTDSLAEISELPSFEGQRAAPPSAQPAKYAMESASVHPPDPASRKEREQMYREVFRAASDLDVKLSNELIRYAREMNPYSRDMQVQALTGQLGLEDFFKTLEPTSPHYKPLIKALAKYRALEAQGPQQMITDSVSLRLGDTGNGVRNLQRRLQQEGFYDGKISGSFDGATQEALKQFQMLHLTDPDGVAGQKTREWLNVSFAQKADWLAQALHLLRQSPSRPYDRYVRINIPQFLLEYYRDGKLCDTHRVIVGKAAGKKIKVQGRWIGENHTPTLASQIEQVIINPRWYVSSRIRMELNDEIASDPNYFAHHGYVTMASSYAWGAPRIFQLPGPTNPLGQIKFEFQNDYAVFLHDTPKKQLFQRYRRDFSHGCVRVDKALELAQLILADDQNPAAQKLEGFLGKNSQTFVRLQQPVPIIMEYVPASTNSNGQVIFCGDPYGWYDSDTKSS